MMVFCTSSAAVGLMPGRIGSGARILWLDRKRMVITLTPIRNFPMMPDRNAMQDDRQTDALHEMLSLAR
jgi:hypothetical protein